MGFVQSVLISSEIDDPTAIARHAIGRWSFLRRPRQPFRYPRRVLLAPPELTDYRFGTRQEYEHAVELVADVEGGLRAWSQAFPDTRFAFIAADCFGGTCLYGGFVCQDGRDVASCSASSSGHSELLAHVGLNVEFEFPPFERNFFEEVG